MRLNSNGILSLTPPPATGFSLNSPLFLFVFQSVIGNSLSFTASPNVSLIQRNTRIQSGCKYSERLDSESKIVLSQSSCGGNVPDSLIAGSAEYQSSVLFLSARKQNPRRPKSAGVRIGSLAMTYFHWKYNQLSSAQRRFTVLFGMGRSGTATLWSPGLKRAEK